MIEEAGPQEMEERLNELDGDQKESLELLEKVKKKEKQLRDHLEDGSPSESRRLHLQKEEEKLRGQKLRLEGIVSIRASDLKAL